MPLKDVSPHHSQASGLLARLQALGAAGLDFILPPRCMTCGEMTSAALSLCGACWRELSFISDPACMTCGLPFEYDVPGTHACAGCIRSTRPYARAFSPLRYDDASRPIVLGLKNGDRTANARYLARLMAAHVPRLDLDAPLVVPVPLHRWRLLQRQYNQSALIARDIAKACGLTCDFFTLRRVRATPQQKGLSRRERERNLRQAFAIKAARQHRIKGRDILLIDDVFTTGATIEGCARTLSSAGAGRIGVLTATRVVQSA